MYTHATQGGKKRKKVKKRIVRASGRRNHSDQEINGCARNAGLKKKEKVWEKHSFTSRKAQSLEPRNK